MIRSPCRYLLTAHPPRFPTAFSSYRRCLSTAAPPGAGWKPSTNSYIEPHHDRDLRLIFDSQTFWKQFSSHGLSAITRRFQKEGLFQNRFLTEPQGFLRFAEDTKIQCQRLVDAILQTSTSEEYKELPRKFDRLSDALCRVLDAADFVRSIHSDPRFQNAAGQAYAKLWEYMNVLNTTPGLNAQLEKALSTPEICSTWTEEELTVAKILLRDFSVSAIDLPEDKRSEFVELSNDSKRYGYRFLEKIRPREEYITLESQDLTGLDPTIIAKYHIRSGKVAFPTVGEDAHLALCSVHNELVRKRLYIAGRQAPEEQVTLLEALLQTRARLAQLSGFKSYAEMNLADKMAGSPQAVDLFLKALSADNSHYVKRELVDLRTGSGEQAVTSEANAWNILYQQSILNRQLRSKMRKPDFASAYLSMGTVMQGLSRLFNRLYGVSFIPKQTCPGETWDSGVRRLDVIHDTEGHIAVLYCDLFARAGKASNPAHFTLRCSRRIWPSEIDSNTAIDDGVTVARPDGSLYQIPTIALVCDFAHPPNSQTPTLLPFRDVQTLFHEMGHAIHSILGRTSLQVVSGTRCPTDFAELPSVLMESFASDSHVLGLFARHWETDEPLPYALVEEALSGQRRWQGIQTETQILNSFVDQACHSSTASSESSSKFGSATANHLSSQLYDGIVSRYSYVREPTSTQPQAFFSHLVEYGGLYYSYLFDRAIAGKIWRDVFCSGRDGGAIDRAAGEKYKDEVLKWGGGRNGWKCVGGVLGDDRLANGGTYAMNTVGTWGVHD